jgi:GDSL-like Lipase/Acylhydrolase family
MLMVYPGKQSIPQNLRYFGDSPMKCHGHAVAGFRTGGMSRRPAKSFAVALLSGLCINLTGCGPALVKSQVSTGTGVSTAAGFSGNVSGGQQPISGSLIQLYAVGTTGDQSPATALLATAVTTSDGSGAANANANAGNANNSLPAGSFTITGDYTCPTQSAQVYLVSTGGNAGLSAGSNNLQIALLAALGQCGSLTPSTHIYVDELTTVASIAPVFNFMGSYSALGSGSADAAQFVADLGEVPEYTDLTGGTVPGPALPSGYYASSYEIRTLGNVLAACIDSTGGVAGDATACGQLFHLATPPGGVAPTNTVQAVIDILANPTANVASIYKLTAPISPFQPALPKAPASWNLPITLLPTTFSASLNSTSDFIGASIINYWPMPVHNNGIVGDTTSQVLARFSSEVLNHGYARVIILCGTNDILQGDPNLLTELPANLQAMAAMANNAGIEVVLSELPPLSGSEANLNPAIISANATIVQLATQHGYLLVDYYTPLAAHPEDFPDGIHPNAAGYVLMEKALSAVVLY